MVWRVQDKAKPKGSRGAALSGSQKKRNRRNSAIRARVEHLFRIAKQETGFAHFEGRNYRALMRHMNLALVVMGFASLHAAKLQKKTAK